VGVAVIDGDAVIKGEEVIEGVDEVSEGVDDLIGDELVMVGPDEATAGAVLLVTALLGDSILESVEFNAEAGRNLLLTWPLG
jgi:hypothetical protein